MPPVLRKNLVDFTRAQFGDLIFSQRIRLLTLYTQNDLIGLENEFKRFKQQLSTEHDFCEMMQQMDDYISFDDAWSTISSRYPLLCNLFGGLASIFPGTSKVESDFSIIGYEKDDYRTSLTNFSLEAILQCKQYELLRKINNLIE